MIIALNTIGYWLEHLSDHLYNDITVIFSRINLLPDNEAHVILAMPGEGEHDSVTFSYTESMQ